MIAAGREHAEAGQEIGVLVALGVVQVRAFGSLVDLIEADRVQHLRLLGIEVLAVKLVSRPWMPREQARYTEVRPLFPPGDGASFPGGARLPDRALGSPPAGGVQLPRA